MPSEHANLQAYWHIHTNQLSSSSKENFKIFLFSHHICLSLVTLQCVIIIEFISRGREGEARGFNGTLLPSFLSFMCIADSFIKCNPYHIQLSSFFHALKGWIFGHKSAIYNRVQF